MPRPCGQASASASGSDGFTLVELTVVLVLLVVLSGLAVPSLGGIGSARQNVAGARVRTAVVFAQEWALGSGDPTWVSFDVPEDRVSVFAQDRAQPGVAQRVPLSDPLTRSPLVLQLGEGGVGLEAVDFAGTDELEFSPDGVPRDGSGAALAQDGTVTLSGGITVRVNRSTGLVTVD